MMTSRAEHRLNLREDNCLERLAQIGRNLGSLDENSYIYIGKILTQRKKFIE